MLGLDNQDKAKAGKPGKQVARRFGPVVLARSSGNRMRFLARDIKNKRKHGAQELRSKPRQGKWHQSIVDRSLRGEGGGGGGGGCCVRRVAPQDMRHNDMSH